MPLDGREAIWTIGHSNRPLGDFVELLLRHSIELVAGVRRFPGSRRHPQFQRDQLESALGGEGIGYRHFLNLGGRRSARQQGSPNTGWRVESFNAYADYMQTADFRQALEELMLAAVTQRTTLLCAEALPWRCHRRLIADSLLVRGWTVLDILGPGQPKPHRLTEFARWADGALTYPGRTLF